MKINNVRFVIHIGLEDVFIPIIIRQALFHQIFQGVCRRLGFLVANGALKIRFPAILVGAKQYIGCSEDDTVSKWR